MDLRKEKKSSRTKKNGINGNSKAGRQNGQLTTKEKLFVEEYLKDFNATRAYKVVHGDKMQESSARVLACKTLKNIRVMAEIDRRLTKLFARLDVSNDILIAGYVNEAFMDNRSFFINDVFIGMNQLNIVQQACIQSVETEKIFAGSGRDRVQVGVKTKVKFYSRKTAMDALMKYKGLVKDVTNNTIILGDNKTDVTVTVAKELREALGDDRIIELNKLLKKGSN